jgi:hypothetical protein
MLDTFRGLPVHALVVHAVVVLVPLTGLGLIVIAAVPRWRQRFGILVALGATAALVAVPVATASGKNLQKRINASGVVAQQINHHRHLGQQVIWFVLVMWVLAVALVLVDRAGRTGGLAIAVALLAALAGIAATAQVVRAGEAGSTAVWKCTIDPKSCSTG